MRKRAVLATVMICVSAVSACSGSNRTRAEGATVGVAIGAGAGAVIGNLVGAGDARKGAVLGAAIGALLGLGAGNAAALEQERYAQQEDALLADIQNLQTVSQQLDVAIAERRAALQSLNEQIRTARRQVRGDRAAQRRLQRALRQQNQGLASDLSTLRQLRRDVRQAAGQATDQRRKDALYQVDRRLSELERMTQRQQDMLSRAIA